MLLNLDDTNRNINQFYLSSKITITELYKAESYIEQLRGIVLKLESLLAIHKRLTIESPTEVKETKQYAKLINDIATELHYLKATNDAMEDNINEINKSEKIQYRIGGRIMVLKKQINRIIKKTDKILSP